MSLGRLGEIDRLLGSEVRGLLATARLDWIDAFAGKGNSVPGRLAGVGETDLVARAEPDCWSAVAETEARTIGTSAGIAHFEIEPICTSDLVDSGAGVFCLKRCRDLHGPWRRLYAPSFDRINALVPCDCQRRAGAFALLIERNGSERAEPHIRPSSAEPIAQKEGPAAGLVIGLLEVETDCAGDAADARLGVPSLQ